MLASSMGVSSPAGAAVISWCSGDWTIANTCNFVFSGAAFYAGGTATAPTVGVRVTVSIVEPVTETVLHSCTASSSDGRSVLCGAESMNLPTDPQVELTVGAVLRCVVSGVRSGSFVCASVPVV